MKKIAILFGALFVVSLTVSCTDQDENSVYEDNQKNQIQNVDLSKIKRPGDGDTSESGGN